MPTYTFHHYETGGAPAGVTFGDFGADADALDEALRLLRKHDLECVEVCELRREVGHVRRHPEGVGPVEASGFATRAKGPRPVRP